MRSSLLKNFSFLTANNVLMPVASMALVIAISRLGGVELLGQYSLLITFFFIGQTCSTAGLHIILTREIARSRAAAGAYFVGACILGVAAAALISAILVPTFTWSVPDHAVRLSLLVMAVALVPTVVGALAEAVLLAFEHAEDFVIIGLVESLLRTAVATALVVTGHGLVAVAVTILAFRTVAAVATVLAVRRRGSGLDLRFDRGRFRELLAALPVVGSIPIVNALYWRLDTLLLTWMRGIVDVGYYGASTRILDIARSLPQAYARALYPVLSRLHHERSPDFRALYRESLLWVLIATLAVSLATFGLADWIVTLLYGADMAPAARGLAIVAWAMAPYALTTTLAQILFATGNQVLDLRVNLAATVVNLALNLALIPRWGFIGASGAALGSMLLHVSLQYAYVRYRIENPRLLGDWARAAGAAALGAAVIVSAPRLHPIAVTAAGLACYGVGLWVTGLVRRSHLDLVRVHVLAPIRASRLRAAAVTPGGSPPRDRHVNG